MYCQKIIMSVVNENCYIYINEQKECLIIDPGSEKEKIIDYIAENGLTPLAVLLTHGHFDHIISLDSVRDEYNIPCLIHVDDELMLGNPRLNCSAQFSEYNVTMRPADIIISEEQIWQISNFSFEIFHTPGHSQGSVCFYDAKNNLLFSGDTLFNNGLGRTDLIGSDLKALKNSIVNKIFPLPEITKVYPGHGRDTTIGREKAVLPKF